MASTTGGKLPKRRRWRTNLGVSCGSTVCARRARPADRCCVVLLEDRSDFSSPERTALVVTTVDGTVSGATSGKMASSRHSLRRPSGALCGGGRPRPCTLD